MDRGDAGGAPVKRDPDAGKRRAGDLDGAPARCAAGDTAITAAVAGSGCDGDKSVTGLVVAIPGGTRPLLPATARRQI
jgi:hypothetical protein